MAIIDLKSLQEYHKWELEHSITKLKEFQFPFISRFNDDELFELKQQVERIRELSDSYLNFLNYSIEKATK